MELGKKQKIILILIAYAVANILSVILTYRSVPGMFSFIFWGVIAPLVAISISWVQLKKHIPTKRSWIITSLVLSLYFVMWGGSTLFFIASLWATI